MKHFFKDYFDTASNTIYSLQNILPEIELATKTVLESLLNGGTIYWFGNGGSASDAEHLSAELGGKFRIERKPLRSFSLTSNSSLITAIANDFGYEQIFARQVEGVVNEGDVVIGISTSGKSKNVLLGLLEGKKRKATSIALFGETNINGNIADLIIKVPSKITSHIQECHIAIGQAICGYIEGELSRLGKI